MWRRNSMQQPNNGGEEEEEKQQQQAGDDQSTSQLTEMLWTEFLVRSSRPPPPMSANKQQKHRTTPTDSSCKNSRPKSTFRPLPGFSLEEPSPREMARIIEKQEQDLEIAANIGNSLLQENKELHEKNEFLDKSLATSNETIAQLQQDLKQRRKLFRTIVDLEHEHEEEEAAAAEDQQCGGGSGLSSARSVEVPRMEKQIAKLEKENKELRVRTDKLEEQKVSADQHQQNVISDYMHQLRGANLKIAQMQVQIGEKSHQCEAHAEEVQRLLADIAQRKKRERILWDENEDIQMRLDEAVHAHEQLKTEMEQLQERHLDLIGMLRDTEDELKMHRQKAQAPPPPLRRTNSMDSLYDSLASELEGADSGNGCYGTPMFSARYGPPAHCSSLSSADQQHQQLSPSQPGPSLSDNQIVAAPPPDLPPEQQNRQNFDVPSRALLEAVRSTFEERKHFQRMNRSPSRQKTKKEENASGKENGEVAEMLSQKLQKQLDSPSTPVVDCAGMVVIPSARGLPARKTYQDASCSPIQFPSSRNLTPRSCTEDRELPLAQNDSTPSTVFASKASEEELLLAANCSTPKRMNNNIQQQQRKNNDDDNNKNDKEDSSGNNKSYSSCCAIAPSSSAESLDSLSNYCPPKLGTPGRPGTKDLDFSIRRLSLQKEVNESYAQFRSSKGLPPSQSDFYSPNGTHYQLVFQSSFKSRYPSKQLTRLCREANAASSSNSPPTVSKSSPACARFSYRPIQRHPGISESTSTLALSSSAFPLGRSGGGVCRISDLFYAL